MQRRTATLALLALTLWSCGREQSSGPDNGDNVDDNGNIVDPLLLSELNVDVPAKATWVNTGVRLKKNERIVISGKTTSGNLPVGNPIANKRSPMPMYGEDGLIGRVGEDGYPFVVAGDYVVQGSSLSENQFLYLGRNLAPPQPFVGAETSSADGTEVAAGEVIKIPYSEEDYVVNLQVRLTDAPAVLTPIDGFYGDNPNPIFDWDEIDNASQYNLDMSDFPDFRRVIFSINVATTSINTATFQFDPNNPTGSVNPNLTEGLYYWRVRAQVNDGRLLNPNLTWTERSVAYRIGVETQAELPPPELLTPAGPVAVAVNTVIPFEILAIPDASGLEWRYRFFAASCGNVVDPSDSEVAKTASPWMVFQKTYRSNRIDLPDRLYGSFTSPVLSEGSWLVRIETRDALDLAAVRAGTLDYEFNVGCD